ncbi:hypothetical protein [Enterovibrio nigricans]|uniref:Uncharacterized protein n=1 Tax=Enterovibrio nigricans DSM 22720 TaxID=1121868 RepID=A0A1T4V1J6_9GAMM|nr:hypothetical protein [Enterovibrio nigricans]PKF50438.1 hypothetical protein AT251_11400 [Enterovibrio nigricans]SKA58825.1 hypothetical protein SAMN02745132_03034 [Enterovibrio nigricans DSM 22720]
MESKLYIVINAKQLFGQSLSKRLAQRGNTVVFLSNDEQLGYALAAEEPRVRFRYCESLGTTDIASEFLWSERCISTVHGVVIIVPIDELSLLADDYRQSLLSAFGCTESSQGRPLCVTYVVLPKQEDDHGALKSLHLDLCKQSHNVEKTNSKLKLNHIIMSDFKHCDSENNVTLANDTSELIHYLTSTTAKCLKSQTFYFANI